jgi:hypothetical protein
MFSRWQQKWTWNYTSQNKILKIMKNQKKYYLVIGSEVEG